MLRRVLGCAEGHSACGATATRMMLAKTWPPEKNTQPSMHAASFTGLVGPRRLHGGAIKSITRGGTSAAGKLASSRCRNPVGDCESEGFSPFSFGAALSEVQAQLRTAASTELDGSAGRVVGPTTLHTRTRPTAGAGPAFFTLAHWRAPAHWHTGTLAHTLAHWPSGSTPKPAAAAAQ